MVQQFSVLIFLFLFMQGNMMGMAKAADACEASLGACGTDCSERCKKQYEGDGECELKLCKCYYTCNSSTPPSSSKKCLGNDGECGKESCDDECCMSRCKIKYPNVSDLRGFCDKIIGTSRSICSCEYDCSLLN